MENLEEFKIPQDALERLSDPEIVRRHISEGKSFQEILGYSDETMDKFYAAAYNLFQMQQYEEAANAFVFLTTLNPYVHCYWLGLGMCEQLNQKYDAALIAYGMAILTDVENPLPHYHSASCYNALNEPYNAITSLEMVTESCHDRAEYDQLKKQAFSLIKSIKKNHNIS